MVVKIESKNGKKAIYLEGALRVISGINQNRAYIRANNKHFEFDTKILTFGEGDSVELDNYILSGRKATTEHNGERKQRKAKSAFSVNDYLSESERANYAQILKQLESAKSTLQNLEQQAREFYAIASANFEAEQEKLKAQREQEKQAKAEQQRAKDIATFKALAQKLGIKIE